MSVITMQYRTKTEHAWSPWTYRYDHVALSSLRQIAEMYTRDGRPLRAPAGMLIEGVARDGNAVQLKFNVNVSRPIGGMLTITDATGGCGCALKQLLAGLGREL